MDTVDTAASIGALLQELAGPVVVVDQDDSVVWLGGQADGSFKIDVGQTFGGTFSVAAREIPPGHTIVTSRGKRYGVIARRLPLDDFEYTFVLISDLTDLKSKENRLYCLERIVESIHDGVLLSDYEGRIALYNRAQENLEGLDAAEVVGKYLWEAYEYNPRLSEHRRVFKTRVPIIERYQAHAHKNGIPQYLTYSTYPIIRDDEALGVFSISRNETKLKDLLYETIELKRRLLDGEKGAGQLKTNGAAYSFADIKGDSPAIKDLIKEAQIVAMHDTNVLIVGETGTGKELFAQGIHNHSRNAQSPFVAINCAAIPETLLESILFGTVKGAYTGALDQVGLLEYAHNGALFLDEVSSMPIPLQSKMTRVLEERVVRKIGAVTVAPIQCRIISAVNEDPQKLIREERLRRDLYYRLAGTCLIIPPLRERHQDIARLLEYFISHFNHALNKRVSGLSRELTDLLSRYSWPGNVRELRHVVENLMIRAPDGQGLLDVEHVPAYLRQAMLAQDIPAGAHENDAHLAVTLSEYEAGVVRAALIDSDWNISQSAKRLGMSRQSLQYRMRKYRITK